jgi:hypothetical protein
MAPGGKAATWPLLASELVTNSVRRSGSVVSGVLATVAVAADGPGVRVEVTDRSW